MGLKEALAGESPSKALEALGVGPLKGYTGSGEVLGLDEALADPSRMGAAGG